MPNMSGGGDPAFKLFGRNIPVAHPQIPPPVISRETTDMDPEPVLHQVKASGEANRLVSLENVKKENESSAQENQAERSPDSKYNQSETETNSADQEKGFKKPDKILPCPRCNSLDTKFCYFNNYNVNQPRHFCKNCQRYWTAGGTMRNVPIGAGRRKNKHLASQYRQIIVSSDGVPVPVTQIENVDSVTQQMRPPTNCATASRPSTGNGTVLKFGTEVPLCKSMETVLSLGEHKNGIDMHVDKFREGQEELSSNGSTVTVPSTLVPELPGNVVQKEQGGMPLSNGQNPVHCYPAPPWVFPWSPSLSSGAPNNNPSQVQWCPAPVVAVPGICPPNIPLQFVPASYWGCMPVWTAGAGNVSVAASTGCLSPSSSTSNSCSGGSPTLGKHSREANFAEDDQPEMTVVVPKTLRIDDPSEASRSPIWATLGIKPDQNGCAPVGKIFKAFKPITEGKDHEPGGTHILEANPAALSRSHTFQEST